MCVCCNLHDLDVPILCYMAVFDFFGIMEWKNWYRFFWLKWKNKLYHNPSFPKKWNFTWQEICQGDSISKIIDNLCIYTSQIEKPESKQIFLMFVVYTLQSYLVPT